MDNEQRSGAMIAQEYETCERIWKRVAPELEPYPRSAMSREQPAPPVQDDSLPALPGAEEDPCCMGTQARLGIDVLRGFLHEELAEEHTYCVLARRSPMAAMRKLFRQIALSKGCHARRLAAALYLITGERYCPKIYHDAVPLEECCAMLRRRYHEIVCNAFNYARAAQETNDVCLKAMLSEFSKDDYCHASALLDLLGQKMG